MGYDFLGFFQAPRKPVTVHSVSPGLVADAGLAADREERLGAVGSLRNVFQGGVSSFCTREWVCSLLLQAGKVDIYIYIYIVLICETCVESHLININIWFGGNCLKLLMNLPPFQFHVRGYRARPLTSHRVNHPPCCRRLRLDNTTACGGSRGASCGVWRSANSSLQAGPFRQA